MPQQTIADGGVEKSGKPYPPGAVPQRDGSNYLAGRIVRSEQAVLP